MLASATFRPLQRAGIRAASSLPAEWVDLASKVSFLLTVLATQALCSRLDFTCDGIFNELAQFSDVRYGPETS